LRWWLPGKFKLCSSVSAIGARAYEGVRELRLQFRVRMSSESSAHDRRPSNGIGYRATRPEHADLGGSVDASRRKPGRFNTRDVGALYLCREAPTALEEFQTTDDGREADQCVIAVVRFAVSNLLDLTNPSILAAWGVAREHLTDDDTSRCQQIAHAALEQGWEGIQWPSATGKGTSLALYLDHLAAGSSVDVLRVIESSSAK
jgi:RES domain-containing protein